MLPRTPFPLWATLTPVLAALALWMLTESPYVLVFAALGPVVALAHRLDTRRSERRSAAAQHTMQQQAQLEADAQDASRQLADVHAAWAAVASVYDVLDGQAEPLRGHERALVLGAGNGLPISCEPGQRTAIVGPALARAAMRRSIELQLGHARLGRTHASPPAEIAEADALEQLAGSFDLVLQLNGDASARMLHGQTEQRFSPHLISSAQAEQWWAQHHRLSDVAAADTPLTVSCGADAQGNPVWLDLATAPHAIVAGTTGSGKTELLRSWLAALCTAYGPSELNLVLIDYKGGAGFADFAAVPQLAALLTDLDDTRLDRAVRALRSELERRERQLAHWQVRDVSQVAVGQIPRLVLMIDEYQLLIERTPLAQTVLADIAARGRSLGVHLVLCTQHPSQVVREQISANCGLRLCLRVLDAAESRALLGSTDAAELVEPGTLVSRGAQGMQQWRVQPVRTVAIADLTRRWAASQPASPPWLPELSADLSAGIAEQLLDRPVEASVLLLDKVEQRAYGSLDWPMLQRVRIVGPSGSGRSSTLARIAEVAESESVQVRWCHGSPAHSWRILTEAARSAGTAGTQLLLIDDIDDLLNGYEPEYRHAALGILRDLLHARQHHLAWSSRGPTVLDEFIPAVLELGPAPGQARWGDIPGQVIMPRSVPQPMPPDVSWQPSGLVLAISRTPLQLSQACTQHGICTDVLDAADPGARDHATELLHRSGGESGTATVVIADLESWLSFGLDRSLTLAQHTVWLADGRWSDLRALTRASSLPPLLDPGESWVVTRGGAPMRVRWTSENVAALPS